MKVTMEIPDDVWKFLKAAEEFSGLDLEKFLTDSVRSAVEGALNSMDLFTRDDLIERYRLKELL